MTSIETTMRSIIQRIATGPELSKDISQHEAYQGMKAILDKQVDPVQAAIFLIALRMKRETDDEMRGVLDAIKESSHIITADVDTVVDLADPYDGYNRTLSPAPFLPVVLACFGFASVTHGVETLGPKYGITHKQILRAAGINVDLNPQQASQQLANPNIGWTYIDQQHYCPALYHLIDFRTLIVKRPCITTAEVLVGPIRGQQNTHFITGYVHKPYPPIYAMLAKHSGFDSALFIRGTEGGLIPSLRQKSQCHHYHQQQDLAVTDIYPEALDIQQHNRAVSFPDDLPKIDNADNIGLEVDSKAAAEAAAEAGLQALQGHKSASYDALVYGASLCLWHLQGFPDLTTAANAVREVLDSQQAYQRLKDSQSS